MVGSNIFNVLAIAGLAALIPSGGLPVAPALVRFDLPVMLAVSFACLPIFFTGHRISHPEGLLFLAYYGAYACYLVLDATGHDALPAYSAVLLEFALPLTVVTLTILLVRALREPRAQPILVVLPGKKVARFYQIENKIDALLRYELAAQIPVIEQSQPDRALHLRELRPP